MVSVSAGNAQQYHGEPDEYAGSLSDGAVYNAVFGALHGADRRYDRLGKDPVRPHADCRPGAYVSRYLHVPETGVLPRGAEAAQQNALEFLSLRRISGILHDGARKGR